MAGTSVVNLDIEVADLDSILQLYDRIEVWKSVDGKNGTYFPITSEPAKPATLVASVNGPFPALNGKSLALVVNGADPLTVTFSGVDPIPLAQVVYQLNLGLPDVAGLTLDNHLELTSILKGTGASLQVSGSAAAVLGLSTSRVGGSADKIMIGNKNTLYRFSDLAGDPSYFYKTRYYSTKTRAVSAFSPPLIGAPDVVLPSNKLSLCAVDLVDVSGEPVVGRRIIFVPVAQKNVVVGPLNYAILPGSDRLTITTDGAGHAEVSLAIGATVRVFFEGSGYSREFIVPDAPTFNLLTVISTQPDPFSIVQAPPMPIRES